MCVKMQFGMHFLVSIIQYQSSKKSAILYTLVLKNINNVYVGTFRVHIL